MTPPCRPTNIRCVPWDLKSTEKASELNMIAERHLESNDPNQSNLESTRHGMSRHLPAPPRSLLLALSECPCIPACTIARARAQAHRSHGRWRLRVTSGACKRQATKRRAHSARGVHVHVHNSVAHMSTLSMRGTRHENVARLRQWWPLSISRCTRLCSVMHAASTVRHRQPCSTRARLCVAEPCCSPATSRTSKTRTPRTSSAHPMSSRSRCARRHPPPAPTAEPACAHPRPASAHGFLVCAVEPRAYERAVDVRRHCS